MSLQRSPQLLSVAKAVARELRKKQTPAERTIWAFLRNRQLHGTKFLRQHPIIVDDDGRETFLVADFYCAEKRLIIEIDGPIHAFSRRADLHRSRLFVQYGFKVLRLTNHEVMEDTERSLEKILGCL